MSTFTEIKTDETLYRLTDTWDSSGDKVTEAEAQGVVDHMHDLEAEPRRELYRRPNGDLVFEQERWFDNPEIVGRAVCLV